MSPNQLHPIEAKWLSHWNAVGLYRVELDFDVLIINQPLRAG